MPQIQKKKVAQLIPGSVVQFDRNMHIHSWIVFDDNSAVQTLLYHKELELGKNPVKSPGFNAAFLNNVDFFLSYYNFPPETYSQADSGFVNIKLFDIDNKIIEGELDLYFKSYNLTGNFVMKY
jgi:hypothetical protein